MKQTYFSCLYTVFVFHGKIFGNTYIDLSRTSTYIDYNKYAEVRCQSRINARLQEYRSRSVQKILLYQRTHRLSHGLKRLL